jgi:hypothetical protein
MDDLFYYLISFTALGVWMDGWMIFLLSLFLRVQSIDG